MCTNLGTQLKQNSKNLLVILDDDSNDKLQLKKMVKNNPNQEITYQPQQKLSIRLLYKSKPERHNRKINDISYPEDNPSRHTHE